MLITDSGVIIRIPSEQISMQSRYAGGVRVMRVDDETKLIGITVVEKQGEEESAETVEEETVDAAEQEITEE